MEGDLLGVPVDAQGIVTACGVEEKNMEACSSGNHEWHQEMEGEESGQGRIVHREPPP